MIKKLILIATIIAVAIATTGFALSYNTIINQPSGTPPVGWWKMDEDPIYHNTIIRDYSANANTGTASTSQATTNKSVEGQVGRAMTFDGTNDCVIMPDDNSLDFGTNAHTMEIWVKRAATGGDKGVFIKSTGVRDYDYYISSADKASSYNNTFAVSANTSIPLNEWHHLAWVYGSGVMSFYYDGIYDGGGTQTSGAAGSGLLYIGCNRLSAVSYYNGLYDDARIYNYVRTAEQIADDYRAGAYRTIVASSNPHDWSAGLVGYWSFDGQYTTTTSGAAAGTRDASGNGNWGAFNNGVKPAGGISGQALSFDGMDDYVNCGSNASLDLRGKSFTFESWAKRSSLGSYDFIMTQCQTETGNNCLMFGFMNTNNFMFDFYGNGITSPATYTDFNWHHWVGTYDTNTNEQKLYYDGELTATRTATSDFNGFAVLAIGRRMIGASPNYFDGSIDEVRIYNRALSANEVKQHYEQTARNFRL